jgi:hypothetical protein
MTQQFPEQPEEASAEYADPYEDMEIDHFDPLEEVKVPKGTPLGSGQDTENSEPEPFDPRYKDDFEGLMFLGALQANFSFVGHKFRIRTLMTDELLAAARIIKEYEGTVADTRAYATVMVALATISVDGIGLPAPIAEDGEYSWAYERFNYVKAKWFPYTVDFVYDRYLVLEDRSRNVINQMVEQAKKARSQAASTPG